MYVNIFYACIILIVQCDYLFHYDDLMIIITCPVYMLEQMYKKIKEIHRMVFKSLIRFDLQELVPQTFLLPVIFLVPLNYYKAIVTINYANI